MRLRFAARVFSVLSVLAVSILLGTAEMRAQTPVPTTQEKSSGMQKKINVELSTDPSPAQKGSNTVRVKLTDQAGKPITGAQITVTFSMPAMPEMGMAAMKTVVKATDKGSGIYEGKGDLGSGGKWHVTVIAKQSGATVATKRIIIDATGGM